MFDKCPEVPHTIRPVPRENPRLETRVSVNVF